jgi:hypothetical protein
MKANHHFELAAMAENEMARIGFIEYSYGNMERAIKHWIISASAGDSKAMRTIQENFGGGFVQTDVYELALKAYKYCCEEMTSKAREDAAY